MPTSIFCPPPQPGNVLLKSTRQDRRGYSVRIVDFGFSTMRGILGRCAPIWGVLTHCMMVLLWRCVCGFDAWLSLVRGISGTCCLLGEGLSYSWLHAPSFGWMVGAK